MTTNNAVFSAVKTYDTGFIYVASLNQIYYEFALQSAESLRDFYPSANITLYTHGDFLDSRAYKIFSEIIIGIPTFYRSKMWCMARSPYKLTAYIDCDSLITHRDIDQIFNQLGSYDILFGSNVKYTVASKKLLYADKNQQCFVKHHGSFSLYNNTNSVKNFMQEWYDQYVKQYRQEWNYSWADPIWQKFDMFTLWRLINNDENNFGQFLTLKIGNIPLRWNCPIQTLKRDLDKKPVITQIDKNSMRQIKQFNVQDNNMIDNEKEYN